MKKFIVYVLGILTALGVTYAGLNAVDNMITQYLTVSTQAHFGNGVGSANLDGSGVLTFTGIGGFTTSYGMFTQTGNITVTDSNVAYPVTYNITDDVGFGVTLSGGYEMVAPRAGDYESCISAIADTDTTNKRVYLRAKMNGVNIPNSNTVVAINNASTETVIALCAIYDMEPGDALSRWMGSDDAGSRFLTTPAGVNPTRPLSPAVITTIKKISNSD